jgi:hypothetical protein
MKEKAIMVTEEVYSQFADQRKFWNIHDNNDYLKKLLDNDWEYLQATSAALSIPKNEQDNI